VIVPMVKLRIVGLRRDAERLLDVLFALGLVQLEDAADESLGVQPFPVDDAAAARIGDLRLLLARLDGLLGLAPASAHPDRE